MLDALDAVGRLLGLTDPDRWQELQGLATVFESAAASAMIATLVTDGVSEAEALKVVAGRLDIDPATLRARLRHRRPVPAQGAA